MPRSAPPSMPPPSHASRPPRAEALKGAEALRTLELSYNPIGVDGAKAFSDLIKYDLQVSQGSLALIF